MGARESRAHEQRSSVDGDAHVRRMARLGRHHQPESDPAVQGGMPSPSCGGDDSVMSPVAVKGPTTVVFSAIHRRHLLVAFRHLDETLAEVLRVLGAPGGRPLFEHTRNDVDPGARERARRAVDAVRDELRVFMSTHDMRIEAAHVGATRAAHARLDLALVSAAELAPPYLSGYGDLAATDADALATLSERLRDRIAAVIAELPER